MVVQVPRQPKIYHIVHVDRLPSIIADGNLLSDAVMRSLPNVGTAIGIDHIKERRLRKLISSSKSDLYVGQCVPFYFCPRSVMLYVINMRNFDLPYQGGQEPIVHLQADLYDTMNWADRNSRRWAFTTSNAGSNHFEDFARRDQLHYIDWEAVRATQWTDTDEHPNRKANKQAEFLLEHNIPWTLIEVIGVYSEHTRKLALGALRRAKHRPPVTIEPDWYY